jgi:suppressor of ftsI
VAVEQLSLAPGERREILVDMSQGDEVSITAGEAAGVMDRLRGFFEPSSILTSTQILNLRPTGLLPLVTDNLPMRLLADQMIEGAVSRTREFRLGDSVPGINGALWDMNRTDVQAQQGSFERWIVHADTPQAFHIQGVMFLIKNVNGAQPMAEDRGWKDTVWVDGSVELFVSFPQSTSEHFPFTYYSQTLEMADRGTAGQLAVNPTL